MLRLALICALTLAGSLALAGDPPPDFLEGRVVDAEGRPVAGADVGVFWSANGVKGFEANSPVNLADPAQVARFWGNVGQMALWPWSPREQARTATDGSFRVELSSRKHHVMAYDAGRTRGGLGVVPPGKEGEPITIRLAPLVRVHGKIRGPETDAKPSWTHVYTLRPEEPERPVDSYRLISCGSFDADFAMLLPPGRYQLDAYNDAVDARVVPAPELTVAGTEGSIDLGTLTLSRIPEALVPRMTRVLAERKIPPLKDRGGQTPPPVFAADSRGIPADWQPGRSPGKWQLLEFWGYDCPSCITRILPELVRFQAEHAAQAHRFEIISVFQDVDGKLDTVAKMDAALRPIVQHVWGGKPLPFPTLVDPSYRTAESWGLVGYGEMALISPEGKVVAGDLETLRAILDRK